MREIKFRAWNTNEKKMVYFDLFDNDENYLLCGDNSFHVQNDTPIMQFTGLTDQNSKEIYEGDIVSPFGDRKHSSCGVIERGKRLGLERTFDNFYCKGIMDNFKQDFLPDYYQVIGNIYENPELIKPL